MPDTTASSNNRRFFLALLGATLVSASASCATASDAGQRLAADGLDRGPLVDVHCHLFNASDLPAARFLKIVYLKAYRREGAPALLDIEDPDVFDALISLFVWVLGAGAAPKADDEFSRLQSARPRLPAPRVNRKQTEAEVSEAVADYYAGAGEAAPGIEKPEARAKVREAILTAGGLGERAPGLAPPTLAEHREAAQKAMASQFDIGRYLRFFALFKRYRASLADELAAQHKADGFSSVLLCPAMIDYDSWLGERVTKSPLRAQMYVMGAVAARDGGPAVHGYMAFDPLRQALRDRDVDRSVDPIGLVVQALTEYGFLGVKLYPPMGFRPYGNEDKPAQLYPESVDKRMRGKIGDALDAALKELYARCVELHAPILAHAGPSNGGGPGYALRADPAYWLPVFQNFPDLHVCLAHFGGFNQLSVARPGAPLPQGSWDWVFGDYVRNNPDAPVFADISYFSEISGKTDAELAAYAAQIKDFLRANDPDCRHLMFGSDWIMLGLEAAADNYARKVHAFFKDQCGFDQKRLDRLFYGNAARYLGLRPGDKTRARLMNFYRDNSLNPSRLPDFSNVTD